MIEVDREVFQRAVAGDAQAYWKMITPFRGLIFSVALGMLRQTEAAEDLTHDVQIKAFRVLSNLRDHQCLGSWLYSMTRNQASELIRREKRMRQTLQRSSPELTRVVPMAELMEKEKWLTLMEEGIQRLPEPFRVALTMKYLNSFSCREMAEILDISVAAVKSRLFQARKALRAITEKLAAEELEKADGLL